MTHHISCKAARLSSSYEKQLLLQLESRLAALESSDPKMEQRLDDLNSTITWQNKGFESQLMQLELIINNVSSIVDNQLEATIISKVDALRYNLSQSLASKVEMEEQRNMIQTGLTELDQQIDWLKENISKTTERYR